MEKKEINTEFYVNEKIIFEYDNFKRLVILVAYFIVMILGLLFISISQWFAIILGYLLFVVGIFYFIDILFFKCLIITNKSIIKEWVLFGKIEVKYENLSVIVAKRIWTGQVLFKNINRTYFYNRLMIFEIFPIGNKGFEKLKNILINKKIIKGEEYEWNI